MDLHRRSNHETPNLLLELPVELRLHVMFFVSSVDLCRLECTTREWLTLPLSESETTSNTSIMMSTFAERIDTTVWKSLCQKSWTHSLRYHHEAILPLHGAGAQDPDDEDEDDNQARRPSHNIDTCWKARYRRISKETRRTELTDDDLRSLDWFFNFVPAAGGMGVATLTRCFFHHNWLLVRPYPPIGYSLVMDEDKKQQALCVAQFPLHYVSRLPDGEWLMVNDFVSFVSVFQGDIDNCTFVERGFQDSLESIRLRHERDDAEEEADLVRADERRGQHEPSRRPDVSMDAHLPEDEPAAGEQ